jgi:hypothetical protein
VGDRTSYDYGPVTAWYRAPQRNSLEEGFTIGQRPSGSGSQVTLAVSSGGNVVPATTGAHSLVLRAGGTKAFTDTGLQVVDARGRVLPSHFAVSGRSITIAFDDAGAAYPVTVDPWVQGASLAPTGPAATFGTSVAVSADGNTALVGDPAGGVNITGEATIYYLNAGTWSAGTALLPPDNAVRFGTTVALSANGSTALVGDPNVLTADLTTTTGAAYVYTLSGDTWSPPNELAVPATAGGLGSSVSLSGDGLTALVGDPADTGGVGASWVYTDNLGTWSPSPVSLTPPATAGVFGTSVALSQNTTTTAGTAIVGDPGGGNPGLGTGPGAVTVYTLSGGLWTAGVSPNSGTISHSVAFGSAVAIDAAGTHLIEGDPSGGATGKGASSIWGFSAGAWHATILTDTTAQLFGTSVSITFTASGTIAAVGDPGNGITPGNVRVYTAGTGITFKTPTGALSYGTSVALDAAGTELIIGDPNGTATGQASPTGIATYSTFSAGPGWTAAAQFNEPGGPGTYGTSVALSTNGQTAIVGDSTGGMNLSGQATIFTFANGAWDGGSLLPVPATPGAFGSSVALSGDGLTALVGDPSASPAGAATIYTLSGKTWILVTSLAVPATAGDFGVSVALSGTTASGMEAIVGDPLDQTAFDGEADVYTLSGLTWSPTPVLLSPPVTASFFGASVSLSANGATALVGDYANAATIYTLSGTWSAGTPLFPPANPGAFGSTVSLDAAGTEALVGDPAAKTGVTVHGAASVFTFTSSWSLAVPLTLPAGAKSFGSSVSLSPDGSSALVGDPSELTAALTTGAADGYTLSGTWSAPSALPLPTNSINFGTSVAIAASGSVGLVGDSGGGTLGNGAATTFSSPPAGNQLVMTTSPVSGAAGTSPTIGPITVQLQTAGHTPVIAGSPVTVNLGSTSGTGVFSATSGGALTTSVTILAGTSSVSFFYGDTASGTPTITASSTGLVSGTQMETINPGPTTKLAATSSPTATVGTGLNVTVTAQDQFGNTTPSYTGQVHITSSDLGATLPGNHTYTLGDAGVHIFSVTFGDAGAQTVTATDTVTASITGTDNVTVGKGTVTGTVATNAPGGITSFGSSVLYSVSGVTGGGAAPTGTVTFTIGATTLCTTAAVSGGAASCSASNAPGGNNQTVTATFNGDANYLSGVIGTTTLTVTRDSTTTTPAVVPTTTYGGNTVTYSATVTSGTAGTITGTVSFTIDPGTGPIAICTTGSLSAGSASCQSNAAPVGTDTVTATYNGDVQFAPSMNTTTLTVNPPLSVTTTGAMTGGTLGTPYNQSVAATGGQLPYSGWVVHTGALPTGLGINASTGAITGTPTAAGLFTFTVQVTDSESSPVTATSGTLTITIAKIAPTVTPAVLPTTTFGGHSVLYSVTVTSGAGTPTGTVSFTINGTPICTSGSLSGGAANCSSTAAPVGSDTVTATYNGDTNFLTNTGTTPLTVNPPLAVSTTGAMPGGTVGVAYNQSVAATGGQPPYSGWVVHTGNLPTGTSINSATGAITGTPTTAGLFTFTVQVTDSESSPVTATSGTLSITVAKGTASVASVQALPASVISGTSVTYSATITGGGVTPVGTVTFKIGATTLCTTGALVAGSGQCNASNAPIGNGQTVTATYNGDANYNSGPTGTTSLTVTPTALSITTASLPGGTQGLSYGANVSGSGGVPPYSFAVTAGALPPGLGLDAGSGNIFGTPSASGNYFFTVTLSDSHSDPTVSKAFSIAIAAQSLHGYWLVAGDGGIFTFGHAAFYGSTGNIHLQRPVVGMTPTGDRRGYWMVATDGGMFAFGDARFFGSIPGVGLHPAGSGIAPSLAKPIVAMVASPTGNGYLLVASDGGVFAFGDARFHGSCPGIGGCNGAVVAVVPDAGELGYWVVTATGHVYHFGDANPNSCQTTGTPAPITGAVASASGNGCLLVNSQGHVYNFGDAPNLGSAPGGIPAPIEGIVADSTGQGYWLMGSTGAVYQYGDAPNYGSMYGKHLNALIVTAAGF